MTDLTGKHDKLARKLLTDLEVAKEFLGLYLPSEIKERCDFTSLIVDDCSFVSGELKANQADVVYKINLFPKTTIDKPEVAYIYTLVEHQSEPDRLIPLRILQYQLYIIQRHVKEYIAKYRKNGVQLPAVIPIVFYIMRRK